MLSADGEGNVSGHDVASANGVIFEQTAAGIYRVNPDCTGKVEATFHTGTPGRVSHIFFVIVDEGKEVFVAITEPGANINGIVKRQ